MNEEILLILLSWATHLTGYEPQPLPDVHFETHQFFVYNACYNVECNVVGWYNDKGVVYIDERYRDDDTAFAASLVVHEFVHYLQHKSGHWDNMTCEKRIQREREAYFIQNEYVLRAHDQTQRIQPKPTWCKQ